MFALITKVALNVLAGVGVANVFDNWIKPKVPSQYYPEPIGTVNPFRIGWLVVVFVVAFMAMNWLGKSFGIAFLKRKI